MKYGYVRVSSLDQCEDRQILALQEIGVEKIFIDKASGKDFNRPNYKKLCSVLNKGDIVVIKSIDRLGRNYEEIQNEWRKLTKTIQADIVVLDMPLLDTRKGNDLLENFISDLVLQILSFVAETERTFIKERQREGILAAKKRGTKFGRPKKPIPEDFNKYLKLLDEKRISLNEVLNHFNIGKTTFYRMKAEYEKTYSEK